jgi:hypothetical protein
VDFAAFTVERFITSNRRLFLLLSWRERRIGYGDTASIVPPSFCHGKYMGAIPAFVIAL